MFGDPEGDSTQRQSVISAVIMTLFLVFVAFCGVYQLQPPDAVPADAPQAQFSSARAMEHLKTIAAQSHRIGTPQHRQVRDYIFGQFQELGLNPQIHKTQVIRQWPYRPTSSMYVYAATIENIIARLPGTANSKAVLLMSHYDSAPGSYGASDDGAGVATMLETLRALNAGPPLKNDVIFLVTDGEEIGLMGAKAFVDEHPWAQDVGLVLNFESRGTSGISFMFETSGPNAWLTAELGKAAPYPATNSLAYEIYKRMPNNTDLTIFKEAGFPGFNFAYIGDRHYYHTCNDNIENIDERSVQHHGSYALPLTRHFGNLDLSEIPGGNAVYFNPIGFAFVRYPQKWAIPFASLTTLGFLAVGVVGVRTGRLNVVGIALGFLAFLANLLIASVIVLCLIRMVIPPLQTLDWWGLFYNDTLLLLGFAGLTVGVVITFYRLLARGLRIWHLAALAIMVIVLSYAGGLLDWRFVVIAPVACALLYFLFRRGNSVWNLAAGAQLGWAVLMLTSSIMAPGASYLFTWPLLLAVIATGIVFARKGIDDQSPVNASLLAVLSIPAVLWYSGLAYLYFLAMGMYMDGIAVAITMAVVVLLMSLLVPHCLYITSNGKWWMPGVAGALGVAFILTATFATGFDDNRPKPNSVFYHHNSDIDKSFWCSMDSEIDEWTSHYVSPDPESHASTELTPGAAGRAWKVAPSVGLAPPEIIVTQDTMVDETRTLKLHVASKRHAPELDIGFRMDPHLVGAEINGAEVGGFDELNEELASTRPWRWVYHALPGEGIDLTLHVRSTEPFEIRLTDVSYDLPEIPGFPLKPRPTHMMPMPALSLLSPRTDVTKVSKTFEFQWTANSVKEPENGPQG